MARVSLFVAAAVLLVGAVVATETVTLSSPTFDVLAAGQAGKGWRQVGAADPEATVSITIAPKRSSLDELANFVQEVSDPKSARYTHYLSTSQVAAFTKVDESVSAVTAWLEGFPHEVNSITGTIKCSLAVKHAANLFSTTFSELRHDVTGQTAIIGAAVNVPVDVAVHIEAVFGVHGLPLPPRQNIPAPETSGVTPSVITSVYNVSGITPRGSTDNVQAVAEFQGQLISQADLTTFFSKFVPNAKSGDDKVYKYVGDNAQGQGVEANLDIQYIMGVAPGIKTEAWEYAGSGFCSDMKDWTQGALSTSSPPNVFSVSYGWQGKMSQIGCSTTQIDSIDADFKSMAAAGITIIIASGDSGSGYTSFFGYDPELYASWPASSTYVTAVGATNFINAADPTAGERAVSSFGSGGGFSRVITPAPAWQTAPIATFYSEETKAPNASTYGYGGRGTPDVAALGMGFQIIVNGGQTSVGGTSAAAPTFAGIVSMLNEARIQHGKKQLGLLNNWIYQNSDMLTDITQGSDRVSRQGLPVPLGFDCEKGWDPVTGWGTPNFSKMVKAALDA